MRIDSLTIEQLRLFDRVVLEPGNGINLLVGDNGAGKTSVLEAIHLLSSGRSFRGGVRDALIRQGDSELRVFARLHSEADDRAVRLGLSRSLRGWNARLDGEPVELLSRLFQELAVVCFEPGSHALVSGGSEQRRRFVDWALFHVEPGFLSTWRHYQRALKQRNALLKREVAPQALDPWENELARHGAALGALRAGWIESFLPWLSDMSARFLPELGAVRLRYLPGWTGGEDAAALADALHAARPRDLALGHTSVGPHRADWSIGFEALPVREMFSRGQEKLVVLAALLAQASGFARLRGQWPILLLDDLSSELDERHLASTLEWLGQTPAQVFVTGTRTVPIPPAALRETRMFHVEQGRIAPLL